MSITTTTIFYLSIFFSLFLFPFQAHSSSPERIHTVYTSLDPLSVRQLLAFYRLYPDTDEGKEAVRRAWRLLLGEETNTSSSSAIPELPDFDIDAIVSLVNRTSHEGIPALTNENLSAIEQAASRLANRAFPGNKAKTEEEVLVLAPSEIDISRALLLSQLEPSSNLLHQVRSYEAILDLMALQIAARLSPDSSPMEKIQEINRFIFEEMRYRFPPHSLYAADIDLYTFLPSVLDSRRGVCLGVSLLYLCLAQRLELPLEIITPPGHVYIRYRDDDREINIETTARGIDLPSEEYLNIDTRSLQQRTTKEIIGLAHMNRAAVFWQRGEHKQAIDCYHRARRYLPNDLALQELLGYNLLFEGEEEEGKRLLEKVRGHIPDYAVSGDTITEDYLHGHTDAEGIKAIFQHVDETRESILSKQHRLQKVLMRYPRFRAGIFQLAITWLQLNRSGEALQNLQRYHDLDDRNPDVEYYLAILTAHRMDYLRAWDHLRQAKQLVNARDHHPKALQTLRRSLMLRCPKQPPDVGPITSNEQNAVDSGDPSMTDHHHPK